MLDSWGIADCRKAYHIVSELAMCRVLGTKCMSSLVLDIKNVVIILRPSPATERQLQFGNSTLNICIFQGYDFEKVRTIAPTLLGGTSV